MVMHRAKQRKMDREKQKMRFTVKRIDLVNYDPFFRLSDYYTSVLKIWVGQGTVLCPIYS